MSFSIRKNTYRCFVCGEHGGTIDLVMKHLRKDFKEAVEWLGGKAVLNILSTQNNQSNQNNNPPPFDASRYERYFERPWLSPEARRFLFDERKLDPRVVRWCRLTSWKDRQGTPWLQIPYYDMDGKLIGVQNRRLSLTPSPPQGGTPPREGGEDAIPQVSPRGDLEGVSRVAPRFRFPAGSRCGIYNLPVLKMLKPGEELWITEGCSDCWAMLSSGHKAIAIPSATLLSQADKEQLSIVNCQLSIKINMFPDADVPGERLFLQLKEVLPNLVRHQLPEGCKDYSDFFLREKSLVKS
jgi:hypothetical protein